MRTVVRKDGSLTLPEEVLRWLGVAPDNAFEVEVCRENGSLVLRPTAIFPDEDAWYYTPENQEKLNRAMEDVRAGRVFQMSEAELKRLGGIDEDDSLED